MMSDTDIGLHTHYHTAIEKDDITSIDITVVYHHENKTANNYMVIYGQDRNYEKSTIDVVGYMQVKGEKKKECFARMFNAFIDTLKEFPKLIILKIHTHQKQLVEWFMNSYDLELTDNTKNVGLLHRPGHIADIVISADELSDITPMAISLMTHLTKYAHYGLKNTLLYLPKKQYPMAVRAPSQLLHGRFLGFTCNVDNKLYNGDYFYTSMSLMIEPDNIIKFVGRPNAHVAYTLLSSSKPITTLQNVIETYNAYIETTEDKNMTFHTLADLSIIKKKEYFPVFMEKDIAYDSLLFNNYDGYIYPDLQVYYAHLSSKFHLMFEAHRDILFDIHRDIMTQQKNRYKYIDITSHIYKENSKTPILTDGVTSKTNVIPIPNILKKGVLDLVIGSDIPPINQLKQIKFIAKHPDKIRVLLVIVELNKNLMQVATVITDESFCYIQFNPYHGIKLLRRSTRSTRSK